MYSKKRLGPRMNPWATKANGQMAMVKCSSLKLHKISVFEEAQRKPWRYQVQ